jgi:hypothetical protein
LSQGDEFVTPSTEKIRFSPDKGVGIAIPQARASQITVALALPDEVVRAAAELNDAPVALLQGIPEGSVEGDEAGAAPRQQARLIKIAGGRIHDVIHKHNPNRKPPSLSAKRESDDLLEVDYRSHRELCPVVRGIICGLGEKYGERFDINEIQCMYDGADKCVMRVTRLP